MWLVGVIHYWKCWKQIEVYTTENSRGPFVSGQCWLDIGHVCLISDQFILFSLYFWFSYGPHALSFAQILLEVFIWNPPYIIWQSLKTQNWPLLWSGTASFTHNLQAYYNGTDCPTSWCHDIKTLFALLTFVNAIPRPPVDSTHKGPMMRTLHV